MRVTGLLTLGLCAFTVAARSLERRSEQNALVDDPLKVPGENPLNFCAAPDDNILRIDNVDLSPNPPQAGIALNITATGEFKENVEEGAKIFLEVKYGLIRILRQEADLCETVANVDLKCPLDKGVMTLTKSVDLPNQIPPGRYTVLADVVTKDGDKITCLTAQVTFSRNGASFFG